MATFRQSKGETPFTRIESASLQDNRLSWKARGLLAYILSKPDNFKFHLDELTKHAPDGLDSVKVGIKELELLGYVKRYPVKVKGKIVSWVMDIYEIPQVDFPQEEKPQEEKPLEENPMLITNDLITIDLITNDKKNNIYSVFNHWNSKKIITHREFTDATKSKVNARLQAHTLEKLIEAIDNYHTCLIGEDYYYTYKFNLKDFMKPENLEKFLTMNNPFENFKIKFKKKQDQGNIREMADKLKRKQGEKANEH